MSAHSQHFQQRARGVVWGLDVDLAVVVSVLTVVALM